MNFSIQLLKQLFFIIFDVIWTIIKTISVPIYTTTVKTLLVAACLWCLCKYVPHGLPFVANVSFIGWISIIVIYRMVTLKYDDFNDEDDVQTEPSITPNYLKDEEPQQIETEDELVDFPPPPRNVGLKTDDTATSTRE